MDKPKAPPVTVSATTRPSTMRLVEDVEASRLNPVGLLLMPELRFRCRILHTQKGEAIGRQEDAVVVSADGGTTVVPFNSLGLLVTSDAVGDMLTELSDLLAGPVARTQDGLEEFNATAGPVCTYLLDRAEAEALLTLIRIVRAMHGPLHTP